MCRALHAITHAVAAGSTATTQPQSSSPWRCVTEPQLCLAIEWHFVTSRLSRPLCSVAHTGWTMCSLVARLAKSKDADVTRPGEILIDFLVNRVWTTGVESLGRVSLVSNEELWAAGTSVFRTYQFQGIPNKIRINATADTDRFSINEVRSTLSRHKQASNQAT
jgi:hypothetical protein